MELDKYLESELPNLTNFPELRYQMDNIEALLGYSFIVMKALDDYNGNVYDRVDVNTSVLQGNIDLCRSTCEVLGKAPKVCYDMLLQLRELQKSMQMLMYMKRAYGDRYVGTPTNLASGAGEL